MKVILLNTIKGLGSRGDVVNASKGFVMNYLIPKHKALPATNNDEQIISKKKKQARVTHTQRYAQALALAAKIKQYCFIIKREATQNNQLYNAINKKDILLSLASFQIHVNHSSIHIINKMKAFGIHKIDVQVYHNVKVGINIKVIKK